MSLFRNIFSKLYCSDKLLLGRWNLTYQKEHIDRKIYLANYDHCGPCGDIEPIIKIDKGKENIYKEKRKYI